MSANAIETLRGLLDSAMTYELDASDGLRSPIADALAAVEALLEGVKAICAEPTTSGPAHDKATRVTSYRALREILEPLVRRVETGQ